MRWPATVDRRLSPLPGLRDRPPIQTHQSPDLRAVLPWPCQGVEIHPPLLGQHGAPPRHQSVMAGGWPPVRGLSRARRGQPPQEEPGHCTGFDDQNPTPLFDHQQGVPLFIEVVTKLMLESEQLQAYTDHDARPGPLPALAIPATLHDGLMAPLDRLASSKAVVQLGAVQGRTFAYDVLHAVSPWEETALQHGLYQLVEAELVYQRGVPPQATYCFKHALIQETAYQSLLKSIRQQYHQQIAQVLEAQFHETAETQPELLAQHYTEAALPAQAIPCWQQAGLRALQRSANLEAVQHLTTGLALQAMLPAAPPRAQQELDLQIALGPALMATMGFAAPEVEQTYARARVLCQQIGETPQLFSTLQGLCGFYRSRGALPTARELGEQLYELAQRDAEPTHRLEVHGALGGILFYLGEYTAAWTRLEQGIALIDPTAQRGPALRYNVATGETWCLVQAASTLWCLGYPPQAVRRSQEALALAQELAYGMTAVLATGQMLSQPLCLVPLAEAAGYAGQVEEGLRLLAEALGAFEASGRGDLLTETYWLQGELLLRQVVPEAAQAEACFQQALTVARRQQAKSWELRAAMSLVRLW
jgi:predicted ATPase